MVETIKLQETLKDWYPILKDEFDKDYMRFISHQLAKVSSICPQRENIFKAYELTQPKDVKVVILGQDPYPTPGMAHGLSFSTLGTTMPASLRVIFDELVDSGLSKTRREKKDLTDWAEQGVFLLNSVLTTTAHQALAHGNWGWQNFTRATIRHTMLLEQPIVYLGWGNTAKKILNDCRTAVLKEDLPMTDPRHPLVFKSILESCHPAAQLYGGAHKFIGNRHFVNANYLLESDGQTPIVWDTNY